MFEKHCSSIKILSWNLKGVKEKIHGDIVHKLNEQDIQQYMNKYDIVFIEETHLDKENKDNIYITGFGRGQHFIRPKRKKATSASGGISLFIKEHLQQKITILPRSNCDIVWLQIKNKNTRGADLFIGCAYIPPETSSFGREFTSKVWDKLEEDLEELSSKGYVTLCGDFNSRTGDLQDYIPSDNDVFKYPYEHFTNLNRHSSDKVVQKYGRRLIDLCLHNNMNILNGRALGDINGRYTCYTPHGCSVVDYFICSQEILKEVIYMKVHNLQIYSDHCPLEMKIQIPFIDTTINNNKSTERNKYNSFSKNDEEIITEKYQWDCKSEDIFKRYLDTQDMKNKLKLIQLDIDRIKHNNGNITAEDDINYLTDEVTKMLNNAANTCLKKRIIKKSKHNRKKKNKRWFDKECYLQRRELKSLLNALNRRPYDKNLCQKYYAIRKRYNSNIKKKKNILKNKLVTKLNNDFNNDPNELWKTLKELRSMGDGNNNTTYTVNPMKWMNHLEKLISMETKVTEERKKTIAEELSKMENNDNIPMLDDPITEKEIRQECKLLKPKKSPGKDKITNEIIKASLNHTIKILKDIFNMILKTGNYPKEWKTGISVAIYKKGDPIDPGNYRGITLSSNLSKLFCKIINSRMAQYLEKNNILIKEQAGFRKGYRTSDQIFILKKIVDDIIKVKNGRLYACFVDFQKAFDNVWHEALLFKLRKVGIRGKCYKIIENMYNNTTVCTQMINGYSHDITVKKGVHQGNTLSPTLFNIFINDIVKDMPDFDSPSIKINSNDKISCLLYADDMVMLSKTKVGIQQKLDYLDMYCHKWGLEINKDKTQMVVFCKITPKIKTIFKCGENIIKTTDQYKYLGMIFNQNGKLTLAQEHLSKQGNKAAYSLRKTFRNENVQVDTIFHLFDSLVNPILTYGAEIWFPYMFTSKNDTNDIENFFERCISNECLHESVHVKFCRFILGVHKKAMWIPVLAEIGRFPLGLNMLSQSISYWAHILKTENKSLIHQIYEEMLNQAPKNPWLTFIKELLYKIGFKHVWLNQYTFDIGKLQNAIQEKLRINYIKFWEKIKCEGRPRLKFYSSVSKTYEVQPYLISITNIKHRHLLSKLRTSTHSLKIETGRHNNIPRENRLCNKCNVIEDEIHFLDGCQKFTELRNDFIKDLSNIDIKYSNNKPSEVFCEDRIQIRLGKFISDCFNRSLCQ